MFRLLIFFIILCFIIIAIYAGAQIIKSINKPKNKTTADDIENLIKSVKLEITKAEINVKKGIDGAEKELSYWKDHLNRIDELKGKTNNL